MGVIFLMSIDSTPITFPMAMVDTDHPIYSIMGEETMTVHITMVGDTMISITGPMMTHAIMRITEAAAIVGTTMIAHCVVDRHLPATTMTTIDIEIALMATMWMRIDIDTEEVAVGLLVESGPVIVVDDRVVGVVGARREVAGVAVNTAMMTDTGRKVVRGRGARVKGENLLPRKKMVKLKVLMDERIRQRLLTRLPMRLLQGRGRKMMDPSRKMHHLLTDRTSEDTSLPANGTSHGVVTVEVPSQTGIITDVENGVIVSEVKVLDPSQVKPMIRMSCHRRRNEDIPIVIIVRINGIIRAAQTVKTKVNRPTERESPDVTHRRRRNGDEIAITNDRMTGTRSHATTTTTP